MSAGVAAVSPIPAGAPAVIAIVAGGGDLPPLVAAAAAERGSRPLVVAVAGEAAPAQFPGADVRVVRWGEAGRLFRLLKEAGCRQAVLIGKITHRPDYLALRPDLGTLALLPRILTLMAKRDHSLLSGVVQIFEEKGVRIVSPLVVAPALALEAGVAAGTMPAGAEADIDVAAEAAREIGRRDIAQGAVAIAGRVVAVEDEAGTDALLERVLALRRSGAVPARGGVLVKCLKPMQDGRHDIPTIGPRTAERAAAAGLVGVAGEAGRTLLAGREPTLEAFRRAGLFLSGVRVEAGGADG